MPIVQKSLLQCILHCKKKKKRIHNSSKMGVFSKKINPPHYIWSHLGPQVPHGVHQSSYFNNLKSLFCFLLFFYVCKLKQSVLRGLFHRFSRSDIFPDYAHLQLRRVFTSSVSPVSYHDCTVRFDRLFKGLHKNTDVVSHICHSYGHCSYKT